MGNWNSTESSQPVAPKVLSRKTSMRKLGEDLNFLAKVKRAEDARKEAIAARTHDSNKENQQLLKKIFKRLDPCVSKVDAEVRGEMQVSLKYDFNNSSLLVNVIKCRDLGRNSITGKTAEPFVTISLHPNEGETKRTSVSPNAQNPVFNEKFSFPLEELSLTDSLLVLKVVDHDLVNDEIEFLGEVIVNLRDINFLKTPVHTAWYTLQAETDLDITGELDVELNYSLPHTLSITIHQAANLKQTHPQTPPSAVVKVGLPGMEKVHVTEVKPDDANPSWSETFTYEVPQEELEMRYIVLTVIDQSSPDDALLGHVVIDLDNLDVEHGYRGSFPLADMSHTDRLRSRWFQTTQAQEFREALWAHSFFNYPNILFQNHTGRKVIRLTCDKAGGSQATLRLNNGIPTV